MKILILSMLLTSCSTTIKSPMQFEYTGYIKTEGVGVTVKPPFWEGAIELYEWVIEEDDND